jgi:hypothetical protein
MKYGMKTLFSALPPSERSIELAQITPRTTSVGRPRSSLTYAIRSAVKIRRLGSQSSFLARARAHNIACEVGGGRLGMLPGCPGMYHIGTGRWESARAGFQMQAGCARRSRARRARDRASARETRARRTALIRPRAAASRGRYCSRSGGKRVRTRGTSRPCCSAPSASAPVLHRTWCARSAPQPRSSGTSTSG